MSFDTASKTKSVASFNDAHVYDSINDLHYQAFWKKDNLFIAEYRLIAKDTSHYREEMINYIIGSGQHTNSHFWMDKGYVYQAPMTWYVQENKWGLPPGYETNNIGFSRKIEAECMTCHNSLPTLDTKSTHKYIDIPKGISCERCHGPGSIHVDQKMKGIAVNIKQEADYTIVNPKRLPWKLQIDICQRCHLQGNAVLKKGKSFADFRPGMPLSEVMQVYLPTYDSDNHPFVMASHAERFTMSQCFIQSNKSNIDSYNPQLNFTCINCHNPHISVKETKNETFNASCKSCHDNGPQKLCSEDNKVRVVVNNNCVECHMPLTGAADIPHVSIHDHYIRKPSTTPIKKGKLTGLKSVNGGDTSDAAQLMAYITYFEKFNANSFYQKKADDLAKNIKINDFNELTVHYWYNKQNFKQVALLAKNKVTGTINNHFTAYQVGQSFYNELNYTQSVKWFNRALDLKPNQIEYSLAKIEVLLSLNDITTAQKTLDFVLKEQNRNAKAYYYQGVIYQNQGKAGSALNQYKKALALNPQLTIASQKIQELGSQSNTN